MSQTDEDYLSHSGSPRFGISDENSDEHSIRNRINSPNVASFWMRTMQHKTLPANDEGNYGDLKKLKGRWVDDATSDEATGLSSPSAPQTTSGDSEKADTSGDDSIADEEVENEALSEAESFDDPELQGEDSDEVEEADNDEEGVSQDGDNDGSRSHSIDAASNKEPVRFAWWTRDSTESASVSGSSSHDLTLTPSKKKAALECLTERLQCAVKNGADEAACMNLVEAIRVVAESSEAPASSSSHATNATNSTEQSRRSRRGRSRSHSHRKRSPSNREIREGLIALSELIENKLDDISSKQSSTVSPTGSLPSNSSKDPTAVSSAQESTSSSSNSSMSERIRLEKEQKILLLEQELSVRKSTIEELKALIDAQNANLQSTLAALEHIEKDRADKADALTILKETDKKKSDFIVTLQMEATQLREQLDKVHPAALGLQKMNHALRQDLIELKEQFDQLQRSEQSAAALEERVAKLENENQQLEADVLSMIKCCTEYKKVIEEIQARNRNVSIKPRRSLAQMCQVYLAACEREPEFVPPKIISRTEMACQTVGDDYFAPVESKCPIVEKPITGSEDPRMSSYDAAIQEIAYLHNKVSRLQEEREEADDFLYVAREEKKLLKTEVSRLMNEVRKKESRIAELEFMLDCEAECSNKGVTANMECSLKPADESSDVTSTRESFGWFRNVFQRGQSGAGGASTPTFGSNSAAPVAKRR